MAVSNDFRRGMRACVPALPTIFTIFIGYGMAAQMANVPPLGAFAMTVAIYAAPALYAILDLSLSGATLFQLITIGILANLRFFVMSVTLSQMFRDVPLKRLLLWAQFVAMTPFLLTFFQSRREEPGNLFDYYRGISVPMIPAIIGGTAVGIALGGNAPAELIFGATLFMPIYFSLLLAIDIKSRYEMAAVGLGFTLTPFLETLIPGWGMAICASGIGLTLSLAES